MEVIDKEKAEQEISEWLDHKKVSEKGRENRKAQIETLVEFIMSGDLILEPDTKKFIHKLKFPLEGEKPVKELTYAPRIFMKTVHQRLTGIKSDDGDGRVCAYVSALTSIPMAVIRQLDTEDYKVCEAIAIFFI